MWRYIGLWLVTQAQVPGSLLLRCPRDRDRNWDEHSIFPKFMAAQTSGIGIFETWIAPGTSDTQAGICRHQH